MEFKHKEITEQIIAAYYDVYNDLGYGFLEKVYQNSMFYELLDRGFKVEAQKPINVFRKGRRVGEYYADLVVNDIVIVELKAATELTNDHEAQLINYLRATEIEVGLLFNFGLKPQFERKIWDNHLKKQNKRMR
ncbi:MAG: GxxExxY protein [Saprospiraceae bacterium]|nr:GxxExxY protein [Lewinellaceae bacterium]MBP6810049.1 GxxExxY protein [Saprospiraceae bacterium]